MSSTNTNSFSQLFKYVGISLVFSLLGFVFGQMFIPPRIASMGSMFLSLFFLITFIASLFMKNRRYSNLTMNKVYTFTFIHGLCIYPIINYYAYFLGLATVLGVFIGTITIFIGLSIYAKNKDVSKILSFGPIFSFILLGIIIASFLNVFLQSNTMNIGISAIAIILFTLYIIYMIANFKHTLNYRSLNSANDYAPFVLNLYTDFMNLFLNILSFIDSAERD